MLLQHAELVNTLRELCRGEPEAWNQLLLACFKHRPGEGLPDHLVARVDRYLGRLSPDQLPAIKRQGLLSKVRPTSYYAVIDSYLVPPEAGDLFAAAFQGLVGPGDTGRAQLPANLVLGRLPSERTIDKVHHLVYGPQEEPVSQKARARTTGRSWGRTRSKRRVIGRPRNFKASCWVCSRRLKCDK